MRSSRLIAVVSLALALAVGQGCHKKGGGGYLRTAPAPAHVR